MSGLQTKGFRACPTCGPDLHDVSRYSKACKKCIYLHHTKYLEADHPYRQDPLYFLDPWSGADDDRPKPVPKGPAYWRGVWERVSDPHDPLEYNRCGMVFLSALNQLPYWKEMKINHLLDPMHIEGNIGKSLIKHLYGEKGGNWREACVEQDMHPEVWPYKDGTG